MHHILITIIASFVLLFLPAGCSYKPVRHLASDASLIKPGTSTKADVLRYLGEPHGRRSLSPTVEEYVYQQDRKSHLARLPMLEKVMAPESYETLLVTLEDDQVVDTEFRLVRENDLDWKEDIEWDEVK